MPRIDFSSVDICNACAAGHCYECDNHINDGAVDALDFVPIKRCEHKHTYDEYHGIEEEESTPVPVPTHTLTPTIVSVLEALKEQVPFFVSSPYDYSCPHAIDAAESVADDVVFRINELIKEHS